MLRGKTHEKVCITPRRVSQRPWMPSAQTFLSWELIRYKKKKEASLLLSKNFSLSSRLGTLGKVKLYILLSDNHVISFREQSIDETLKNTLIKRSKKKTRTFRLIVITFCKNLYKKCYLTDRLSRLANIQMRLLINGKSWNIFSPSVTTQFRAIFPPNANVLLITHITHIFGVKTNIHFAFIITRGI